MPVFHRRIRAEKLLDMARHEGSTEGYCHIGLEIPQPLLVYGRKSRVNRINERVAVEIGSGFGQYHEIRESGQATESAVEHGIGTHESRHYHHLAG